MLGDKILDVIPYLASKFNSNNFKRMQLRIEISSIYYKIIDFDNNYLDKFRHINPKTIEISTRSYNNNIDLIEKLFEVYNYQIITFSIIFITIKSNK